VKCSGCLSIFAGKPLPNEQIPIVNKLDVAHVYPARNINFLNPSSSLYQCWQVGINRWLEEWQPDALIIEANPRYPSTGQAIARMHRRGLPVLGWGLGARFPQGILQGWWVKRRARFLNSLDAIIAYSRRGAESTGQLASRLIAYSLLQTQSLHDPCALQYFGMPSLKRGQSCFLSGDYKLETHRSLVACM